MTKNLWDEAYLRSFVTQLLTTKRECQFWEEETTSDGETEVSTFKAEHYKKMLMKFFPALGVWNLVMDTDDDKGLLVFVRGNRCQTIDTETLQALTYKCLNYMSDVGEQIRANLFNCSIFKKDNKVALRTIPELEGKRPFADNAISAYRFFQNGWIEITRNGVSQLKSYKDVPDDIIIWNSSIISRDYVVPQTKEELDKQLIQINRDKVHPITGETIYEPKMVKELSKEWQNKVANFTEEDVETHYEDFVTNLSKNDEGDVDEASLERIKLAIGYLCHRFHVNHNRRWVLLVDKFFDGATSGASNGGNGKSLLLNSLGAVMNLTNLNGKQYKKSKDNSKALAPVTPATEIVHFDDAADNFDTESLFPLVTGDFHIGAKYKNDFSIPAANAPKIAISSNHPLKGSGNSYVRRQFVVEIGNYYRHLYENYGETPYEEHGHKTIPTPTSGDWNENDWSQYYRFVFECVSLYLSKNGLPTGGESEFYVRAKLNKTIGSADLVDYLISKIEEYGKDGGYIFCQNFYEDLRYAFPEETENVSNQVLWNWLCEVGKSIQHYPNKHKHGTTEQVRLGEDTGLWERWVSAGMEGSLNVKGKKIEKGDVVKAFKVSTKRNPASQFSKPTFKKKKKKAPAPQTQQEAPEVSGTSGDVVTAPLEPFME